MKIVLAIVLAAVCLLATTAPAAGMRIINRNHIGALNEGLVRRGLSIESLKAGEEKWFTQRVDHFNSSSGTWQQKYFTNATFWDGTGPVFFILGGEGPISTAYVSGHFVINQYAQQHGALVVALEHRFYGDSMPTPGSSTQELSLLSVQQALADAANFRESFGDLEVVTFGGSYSGCLSAWARLKYPNVQSGKGFIGAFGTSGPVHAVKDFTQYLEVVSNSIGPKCSAIVKAAADQMDDLLESQEGTEKLEELFQTCGPIKTELDRQMVRSSIIDSISGVVQYNNDNVGYTNGMNITLMCSQLDPNHPLDSLAAFTIATNGGGCVDVSYDNYISILKDTGASRSWTYQTCTEFGFYQTGESNNQPFSHKFTVDFFDQVCLDAFGEKLSPNTAAINSYYESINIETSNTFMPNGNVDPWHALGVPHGTDIGPKSAAVLIDGTAHCADMYPPRSRDLPGLTDARSQFQQLLRSWIA